MNALTHKIGNIRHAPPEVLALLSALHLSEPDIGPLTRLCDQEWVRLLELCNIAQLTLPLAQLPADGFPRWVADRLQTNLADNAQRFERIKEIYGEAAQALGRYGIEHIVIKGFTQAPDYVTSPRLRAQSDLDLYCPTEEIPTAQTALEEIGYVPESSTDTSNSDHGHTLLRLGDFQWRGNPFDPEMPLGIELHFCLWNERVSLLSIPEVESFWERRARREIEGLSFPCLSRIDHLGYLALHILRNIFLRDWIVHHVREMAVFLHSHAEDDAFWQSWSATHSPSLRSLEAVAFYHARAWFGCGLHPLVERKIVELPAERLAWLHRFSGSALENMFRQNKDSLWLQISLLSSSRDRWSIFRRTMIPPRVAPIHSPIVQLRNKRLVRFHSGHRLFQYLAYLIFRSASHGSASLATLWHGFSWRLSRQHLSAQFWTFLAASFFFDLGLSIYYFLINLFLAGHGYTERSLGLFTSAMAVGNLASALLWGKLAQRIGLQPVLLVCFALAISLSSARALLLSFSSQLVLAFLAGVTLSAWAVCLAPAVAQLTEEKERPFAFSLLFSLGIGLGALGGLVGGRFPAWFAGHHVSVGTLLPEQMVLLASCAIVALGIWPAAKLRLSRPSVPEKSRPLISPFLLRYLPAIAVWSLVTGSFAPLASVYLARHVHLSLPQIGNAFSLSQIVQVGAVLLAPMLFRRWGLVSGIVFTQIGAAILLLALASSASPLAAMAAYVCFSALQWMNEPGLYSLLMSMVPAGARSGASASNSLVMSASQAIAATLAGSAFVRYGYPAALRGIAVIALLAASLFWNLQSRAQSESSPALHDAAG